MLVCAFVVRTGMLHKALIRLRGCAYLSGILLYVHVCYIRRCPESVDAHACLCFCWTYMYAPRSDCLASMRQNVVFSCCCPHDDHET